MKKKELVDKIAEILSDELNYEYEGLAWSSVGDIANLLIVDLENGEHQETPDWYSNLLAIADKST